MFFEETSKIFSAIDFILNTDFHKIRVLLNVIPILRTHLIQRLVSFDEFTIFTAKLIDEM